MTSHPFSDVAAVDARIDRMRARNRSAQNRFRQKLQVCMPSRTLEAVTFGF